MSSGSTIGVNAAGRRRSPATMPGYLAGRAPRNKGMQYPPDPPRAEEILLVMRQASHDRHGLRVRALIAVLWRAGLRISEALALNETDVDERRGSLLIRQVRVTSAARPGWISSGSNSSRPGWRTACHCHPDRCSASSPDQHEAAAGPRPPPGPNFASLPLTLACGGGSLPTNHVTRMPSSSRAKEWRSTSSNASSGIPTSGPPAHIYRGSTPARSSTPSAHATSRPSPPPPD